MEEHVSKSDAGFKEAALFWKKFRTAVINNGIPENKAQWFEHWARQFSLSIPKIPLVNRNEEQVIDFLNNLEAKQNIEDWQFKQAVEALKILYHDVFGYEWAKTLTNQGLGKRKIDTPGELLELQPALPQAATVPARVFPDELAPIIAKPLEKTDIYSTIRDEMRKSHYSSNTEKLYLNWIRRFLSFQNRPQTELTQGSVDEYLTYLGTEKAVSASTRNQAMNALLFFYEKVLKEPLVAVDSLPADKQEQKKPQNVSEEDVSSLFDRLNQVHSLVAGLIYSCRLRLMECLRLRVQDIDFERKEIAVRDSRGQKKRIVSLPEQYHVQLQEHLVNVRHQHEADLAQGIGEVFLWPSLVKKYPDAVREWGWQYVFPSNRLTVDQNTKKVRRHHIHPTAIQNALRRAAKETGLSSYVNCQILRHSSTKKDKSF